MLYRMAISFSCWNQTVWPMERIWIWFAFHWRTTIGTTEPTRRYRMGKCCFPYAMGIMIFRVFRFLIKHIPLKNRFPTFCQKELRHLIQLVSQPFRWLFVIQSCCINWMCSRKSSMERVVPFGNLVPSMEWVFRVMTNRSKHFVMR